MTSSARSITHEITAGLVKRRSIATLRLRGSLLLRLAFFHVAALTVGAAEPALGTALVRHAPQINGGVTLDGSVHQMLPENVTVNGGATITRDLLVPGKPTIRLNGKPTFGGVTDLDGSAAPTNYQITLNGNASLRSLVRCVDAIPLPIVDAPPLSSGTRNVVINTSGQPMGDWSTLRNLTLNARVGQVLVPPGTYGDFIVNSGSGLTLGVHGATRPAIYNFQRLTLNSQSRLDIVGPVIVTLAHGLNANGAMGSEANPSWLALNIYSGGFTANGGAVVFGYVTAPNGSIIINGNSRLTGGVACDRLTLNGGGFLRLLEPAVLNQAPVAQDQTVTTDEDLAKTIALLGTDVDGATLTFRVVSPPTHGSLAQSAPGSPDIVYTPTSNFDQNDSFTFVVNDGIVDSAPATVSITITPINDRPDADSKAVEMDEDSTVEIVPSGTDVEVQPLRFSIATQPSHGELIQADGAFSYRPTLNWHGTDSFTYVANDGALNSEPASVSIVVKPVNDWPAATPLEPGVAEGGTLELTLQGTDDDGDVLTFRILTRPTAGTLLGDAPRLTYIPPLNSNETQYLTFVVNDGLVDSEPATVRITITNLNDPPKASPSRLETDEDTPKAFLLTGSDPDSDPVSYSIVTEPSHGKLSGNGPNLIYTPDTDFFGDDTFTFKVSDHELSSLPAQVTISVRAVNDVPSAHAQSLRTDEDKQVELTLSADDIENDSLSYSVQTEPTLGTLTAGTGGHFTYTPRPNLHGTDQFTFVAKDSASSSQPATVTVIIDPVNDRPTVESQELSTDEDKAFTITLSGDDLDGDTVSFGIIAPPTHGRLEPSADTRTIVYTPEANFHGEDSFTFLARDRSQAESEAGAVKIMVSPINDAPVALAQAISTDSNATIGLTLGGTDVDDPSGTGLRYNIVTGPSHGTLSGSEGVLSAPVSGLLSPNCTYTPSMNYVGNDSITFSVSDGEVTSQPGLVEIIVKAAPYDPVITFATPADFGKPVNTTSIRLAGTIEALGTVSLSINGTDVSVAAAGAFHHEQSLPNEGANVITVAAEDSYQRKTTKSFTVYRITQAPSLALTFPSADGFVTRISSLLLSGTVGSGATELFVNSSPVQDFANGTFSHPVMLAAGENVIAVQVRDALGNARTINRKVFLDQTPPSLAEVSLQSGFLTNNPNAVLTGRVVDGQSLTINGEEVVLAADGSFSIPISLLEGAITITLETKDSLGNVAVVKLTGQLDTIAPQLTINAPVSGSTVAATQIEVVGTVNDPAAEITINSAVVPNTGGPFAGVVSLAHGENTIVVRVKDAAGNTSSKSISVIQDLAPPAITLTSPVASSWIRSNSVRVSGTVDDRSATVLVNGRTATVADGKFELADLPLTEGANTIRIEASDSLGNASAPVSIVINSDTVAPAQLQLNAAPAFVKNDRVSIVGSTEPGATVSLTGGLAPVSVKADAAGAFVATVLLNPNKATAIVVTASDTAGNQSAPLLYQVVSDTTAPTISLTRPAMGATFDTSIVDVVGTVSDMNRSPTITVNGQAVAVSTSGHFGIQLTLPDGADQQIAIIAIDLAGNQTQISRTVSVTNKAGDEAPPSIVVLSPIYDAVVPSSSIAVTALITDESPVSNVAFGGNPANDEGGDGVFAGQVTVDANGEFIVSATDANNLTASLTHRVRVEGAAPAAPAIQRVSPESPTSETQVVLYGTGSPGLTYVVVGGLQASQTGTVGADGKFIATISLARNTSNPLKVTVTGTNGLSSAPATYEVIQDSIAPKIVSTTPAASSDQVPRSSPVRIVFSEAIRSTSLADVQLRVGSATVNCTRSLSADGATLTLTPAVAFADSAIVGATVPASLTDVAGNPLASAHSFSFKTMDATAPAAPIVQAIPARTNKADVTISGTAEALSTITVLGGVSTATTTADATGRFAIAVGLRANTENALQVTATDSAGNTSASFSQTITHNDEALLLSSSVPAHAATDVANAPTISLTFNKPVAASSLSGVALSSLNVVATEISVNGAVVTLALKAPLEGGRTYEIVVPESVADLFGNRFGTTRRISFTTSDTRPIAVPIVYTVQPTGITNKTVVTVTGYSNPGTTLLLSGGAAPFEFPAGSTIDTTGLFTLEVPLQLDAQNPIVFRARDSQGRLSATVPIADVRQDSILPAVVRTSPQTGATAVPIHNSIFVEFSEAIHPAPLTAPIPAIRLFDARNQVVPGTWALAADARSVTFYPTQDLATDADYSILVGTAVRDLGGNPLPAPVSVEFRTASEATSDLLAAPVLDPLPSYKTTATSITLTGSATAGAQLRVFGGINGATATVDANGRFSVNVDLVRGIANPLALLVEKEGQLGPPASVTIIQLKHAAGVRILSPQPNVEYNNRSITVAGVIDDIEAVKTVTVAGEPAAIAGRFFFRQLILEPTAGAKTVTAVATLTNGTTVESTVAFSLLIEPDGTDTKPPLPRFIFPEEGDVLNGEVVETLLTVEEGVQLTSAEIDHVVAHQVVGNIFFIYARLPQQGPNTITVEALDAAELVGTSTVNVLVDSVGFASAPTISSQPSLTTNRVVTLTGSAEPGSTIVVMNGLVPVRAVVPPSGNYSITVPLNPNATNLLQVVAIDSAGNASPVSTVEIAHDDTPPVVVSTSPRHEQIGVAQNAPIEVTFSEPLNPETVAADAAVVVRSALGQPIQRNVVPSADGKTLRITPSYKFLRGDTITVELAGSIADKHGFKMGMSKVFTFSTVVHQTTLSGIVVDPRLRPLANVKIGLKGTERVSYTSSFGTFILDDVPLGDQILYVDARPDSATGLPPQGDNRQFGYLEYHTSIHKGVDNGLGRPIFLVETDTSTATQPLLTGESNVLTFTPAEKDLADFSIEYVGGSIRFADGTNRGELTVTRIEASNIPDRLPSGAIPHFLVEIGPDGLSFDKPARLGFPNVYDLPVGAEVIVFGFKYGTHNYAELGRGVVGSDKRIKTDAVLKQSGFIGIVPADKSVDLTRIYLEGRVVDTSGVGLPGIPVNAIAGGTYVVTDATGKYSIPMPELRLALIRTLATVSTDLGARSGDSPSLVFQSDVVSVSPSGVTKIPDIVVDSFFLGGSIRYIAADGTRIPVTGLAYSDGGELVSLDDATARGVEILVYRRISTSGELPVYDSQPYLRTKAGLDRFDDTFDASFALSFLGSLSTAALQDATEPSRTPKPGDVVKLVAFDRKTGFYGETDLKIPTAAEADGGDTPLDVLVNLDLRPPVVSVDINRVFFLDGIRRRANIPHRGIAFTDDEYVEFKTIWRTPVATPLDRAELTLPARLRVNSIEYQTDYGFTVRGGEHFRVLELREALVPNRLSILQRDTDVGIETISVSRDGSFAEKTLLPIEVRTDSYGLAQAAAEVAETSSKAVQINVLNLAIANGGDGMDVSGRTLPRSTLNIAGSTITADSRGYFSQHLSGVSSAGGVAVRVGDSLETRFGEALTPHINSLDDTPAGLAPSSGSKGERIVINGRNFSPVASDNKVDFNGAVAVVQSASETQLTVLIPELASSGDVTVSIAGRRSNGVRFEFKSVGINNGSFEDGTLRAYTLEGSGQVVKYWKRVMPTDREYMAFLDTMGNPRDGVSTLTTDPFEVPEGMQTLLFDYQFAATALFRPVAEVLELHIVTDTETVRVNGLFADLELDTHSPISGFDRGSGFRTAGVLVAPWAGTGKRIQLRVVLKGRGPIPEFIPGMNRYDANPMGLGDNGGTGVFLDNFRLSSGFEPALPPINPSVITAVVSTTSATLSTAAGTLPPGTRVFVWTIESGRLDTVDVAEDGHFELAVPFSEHAASIHFLISYGSPPAAEGGGRMFSPQSKLEVVR